MTEDFKEKSLIACIGISALSIFSSGCKSQETDNESPNFIFIFADNMGYGDAGCFGSTTHRTPFLDIMDREGIRLTSLYSSSGVSTPSRASLMTGCYAQRIDMHLNADSGWVSFTVSNK